MIVNRDNFKLVYKAQGQKEDDWTKWWLDERMGKFGASRMSELMPDARDKTKKKITKGFKSYVVEKVKEVLTGERDSVFMNEDMEHGNNWEFSALKEYMKRNKCLVTTKLYGIVNEHIGVSPDGIDIKNRTLQEVKCGKFKTHIKYSLHTAETFKKTEKKHYAQIQANLWALDLDRADFISYYPIDYLDNKKIKYYFQLRIERDEQFIKTLVSRLESAIDMKLDLINKMLIA